VTRNKGSLLATGEKSHSGNSHSPGMQRRQAVCTACWGCRGHIGCERTVLAEKYRGYTGTSRYAISSLKLVSGEV